MGACLAIESGNGSAREHELPAEVPATLGRSRENTIQLEDEHASRRHARIYCDGGSWWVEDYRTLNGTRLDGVRINGPTPLRDGQQIVIGDTHLRFRLAKTQEELSPGHAIVEQAIDVANPVPTPRAQDQQRTELRGDELTAMYDFMAAAAVENDAHALIRRALTAVLAQTGATLAGFLGLDKEAALPKIVLPERARFDIDLSRRLTQAVQERGQPVWLGSAADAFQESDSLLPFQDAMGLPLAAEGSPLGALHVYKSGKYFSERDLRFCEIVAGFLAGSLGRLRIRRALEAENSRLRVRAAVSENLIGASDVMNQLRRRIERIGPSLLPVLIQGETGSGKELVAQGLHRHSARRPGPLVVLNCAAIASTLLETELFGHTRGSFTGAVCDRPGLFQQADEGTLFLDEIGEMSPECQGKLLRVIEGKSFRPVGGSADVQVDVRIIAATHRDLERQVELGKFRQDLFFRLDGARIMAPPLREHSEDIPALVDYFLSQVAAACGRHVHMTPPAIARLQEYLWPGNVRQLRAVLENAVVMSESNEIDAGDLLMPSTGSRVCRGSSPLADALPDFPSSLKLAQIEAWAIRKALRETASHAQAAELLGIARETLYKKRKKYKLDMEG